MTDDNTLMKIRVDDHILFDPKIVSMEPMVFTTKLDKTNFMKINLNHICNPLEMIMKQTRPNYNPRINASKEKLKFHQDLKSYNKFVDKLVRVNKRNREWKNFEIQKLLSSVELAFETIKAQKQQQEKKDVTQSKIENNDKNIKNLKQSDDWSSDDEESLVNLIQKKPNTSQIQNCASDKENETVTQSINKVIATSIKKSGPISVIFANEGLMAVHQGTKQERYDIGSDGSLGRFYIKLPPPPMEDFKSVVKIVCCIYKRGKVINELLEEFLIQPSAVNFMTTIHKCPNGKCVCCCKSKVDDMNYERLGIQPSKNNTPIETSLVTPLATNFQDGNLSNTTEINSLKSLDELVKTLTTNFNGINLTASPNGKLTAVFSTTPYSWDSTKIRILTDILTKISQNLTANRKSADEFCKQINSMVYKRNLYSSASGLMAAKQSRGIFFMKIDDINKPDTIPPNVTNKTDVLIVSSPKEKKQTKAIKTSRKRKNDDEYIPFVPPSTRCSTNRISKPSLLHETYKKWAIKTAEKKSVSVTELLTEYSTKKFQRNGRRIRKLTKRPTFSETKPREEKSKNCEVTPITISFPKSCAPKSPTITTETPAQTHLISDTPSPSNQEVTSVEVPKKNPILFEILTNNNTTNVTSDKFNITKIPIQYLVSKPVGNDTMATLTSNESIELSSDEEVIDLG